jgi:hypothetical protein
MMPGTSPKAPKNADQLLTKSIAVLPALDQLMIKSV